MDLLAYQLCSRATEEGWFAGGDRILVSLSGGADSTALAAILGEFREKIDLELQLVYFDHGLRPEQLEAEEAHCRNLAGKLGVLFEIHRPAEPLQKTGIQAQARDWRRQTLLGRAEATGARWIALGHHLDDLVETQLWRIMRGTSLFGLSPMQVCSPPWLRPLLAITKLEIKDYLTRQSLDYCEDSSNQEETYLRNRIRHRLVPLMSELAGTGLEEKLAKLASEANELGDYFLSLLPTLPWEAPELEYQLLVGLNPLFAREVLHRFLTDKGCREISRHHLQDILRLALTGRGDWEVALKDQLVVEGRQGRVRIRLAQ